MSVSKNVRAELKFLFSPDVDRLENFRPNGPFGILVSAIVRPVGVDGEESFSFILCTPEWFASEHVIDANSIVLGRHFLFVKEFNYESLDKYVRDYCYSCEGATWAEVGQKMGRLGMWEFEDYRPYVPQFGG